MASPIPATAHQGLVRPLVSQLLEFWLPQASPIHSNGNTTDANPGTTHDKSVLGTTLVLAWEAAGSQKAPDTNKHKQMTEKREMVGPPGPPFEDFSKTFVSLGMLADTHTESFPFLDLSTEV